MDATHAALNRKKDFALTRRDLTIVAAVVAGYTNKEIAQKFSISQEMLKQHLASIFEKLGVVNGLELALFAVHHRLVGDGFEECSSRRAKNRRARAA